MIGGYPYGISNILWIPLGGCAFLAASCITAIGLRYWQARAEDFSKSSTAVDEGENELEKMEMGNQGGESPSLLPLIFSMTPAVNTALMVMHYQGREEEKKRLAKQQKKY